MTFTDQLTRLHELHQRGGLTDDEFARAKARLIDGGGASPVEPLASLNALRRSRSERWIAGVCGGIARATGVEPWVWRLAFAGLLLCGGAGMLIYLLLWIFVPQD